MRQNQFSSLILVLIAACAACVFPWTAPRAGAQATPQATPYANAVPCTNLLGIALGNACVLVVHASSDAGPIDVYVDGALALQGLTFATLGNYVPVRAGAREMQIVPSGGAVGNALVDAHVDLVDAVAYEIAVFGRASDLRVQALPVDSAPLREGTSRLRLVNVAPDAPPVNLVVTGGDTLLQNAGYGAASNYLEMAAGTYDLEALAASGGEMVLPLPGTVLAPHRVYSIYVAGQVADGTLTPIVTPLYVAPDLASPVATPVG
jgi:hypothetical protein